MASASPAVPAPQAAETGGRRSDRIECEHCGRHVSREGLGSHLQNNDKCRRARKVHPENAFRDDQVLSAMPVLGPLGNGSPPRRQGVAIQNRPLILSRSCQKDAVPEPQATQTGSRSSEQMASNCTFVPGPEAAQTGRIRSGRIECEHCGKMVGLAGLANHLENSNACRVARGLPEVKDSDNKCRQARGVAKLYPTNAVWDEQILSSMPVKGPLSKASPPPCKGVVIENRPKAWLRL